MLSARVIHRLYAALQKGHQSRLIVYAVQRQIRARESDGAFLVQERELKGSV